MGLDRFVLRAEAHEGRLEILHETQLALRSIQATDRLGRRTQLEGFCL